MLSLFTVWNRNNKAEKETQAGLTVKLIFTWSQTLDSFVSERVESEV